MIPDILETRLRLEAKIEELVALLDLVDGDENLEPYLAGTGWAEHGYGDDREDDDEREPEETDLDGDEGDCCFSEDEGLSRLGYDGSGVSEAEDLISDCPAASRRARSFEEAPRIPIVYDFRGMRS